jgi:zinc transport system substrate-binding protein
MHRFSSRPSRPHGLPRCFQALGVMLGLALGGAAAPAAAEAITVVASIKPVHSLVAGVMQGAGQPYLIIQGGASPHSYSLKPSDAGALQDARLVVWVGEGLETSLESALATLPRNAKVLELAEIPGLTRLAYRAGGIWADHDDHDDHAEEEEHAEEEHAHEADHGEVHAEDHGHEHGAEEIDQHLWLDPLNAKAMTAAIATALAAADPDNAALYRANAAALAQKFDALTTEIAADLAPVKDKPFIVFHDAFQYLDARFGLNTVGTITVDPDRQPGAARLKEIRAEIAERGAVCVFAEPQFEPRLVEVVIEGSNARSGTLDPLGADLPDGPELYFQLMRNNAEALRACLAEPS